MVKKHWHNGSIEEHLQANSQTRYNDYGYDKIETQTNDSNLNEHNE